MIVQKDLVPARTFTGRSSPVFLLQRMVMYLNEAEIEVETPFFSGKLITKCMKDPQYDLVLGNVEVLWAFSSWLERDLNGLPKDVQSSQIFRKFMEANNVTQEVKPELLTSNETKGLLQQNFKPTATGCSLPRMQSIFNRIARS